jgi:hypothetical protein
MAFVAVLVSYLCHVGPCHAQWTVTNLNPAGSTESYAIGASGGQQAGNVVVGGVGRASLWSGTAASRVDLHPAGSTQSYANAISSGQQGGQAQLGGVNRACLWSGTAASWIDLHPAGATNSSVNAISDVHQVGWAEAGGVFRASLWSGTSVSWIDLNPATSTESYCTGASGGQQVGFARVGGVHHASLWSGTAASWIDLNPAGSTQSFAWAASGGQQAGYAYVGGAARASLWSGTAASWVDLHPAIASESYAYAISGEQQVGFVTVGGVYRASLWSGTAASWVDLSAFLPDGFSDSYAMAISSDGVNTYIAGRGYNSLTGRIEALLWTQALCTAANIVSQPRGSTTCPSGPAGFTVTAAGSGTLTYQWQYQSGPSNPDSFTWTNLVSGRNPAVGPFRLNALSTRTRLLVVDHDPTHWPDPVDHIPYTFRCIVTNACGSVTSDAATLTICAADFNCDGFLDFFDYDAFVECFETEACDGGSADFNGDGFVDFFDYDDFVLAFETGC